MPEILFAIFVFIFGLCIGSFLNVCIFRLPAGQSIVRPPSACPGCGNPIRWYDNIPIVSYLMLMGRCRACKTFISLRYPMVELLSGFFALAVWIHFGPYIHALVYFFFIAVLLVVTFIDLDHRIIPDIISLPGIPVGFAASFILPQISWVESLTGILVGGGALLIVAMGYQLLTGKDGMGGGDIKLLAMIGAFIGWKGVLFTIMAASLTGTIAGVAVMMRTGKGIRLAVPFGPFLSTGAILYLFFGAKLIEWYLGRFLEISLLKL
jgi:leader peptidase (prepilin peptidase)/N-methyltransferase